MKTAPPSESSNLVSELVGGFRSTAEDVTPWFVQQMPRAYFRDTDVATRAAHLGAIVAMRSTGLPPSVVFRREDGNEWTFILGESRPGLLARLVDQLPEDRELRSAKVHTAADKSLVIDVFRFGEEPRFDASDTELAQKRGLLLELATKNGFWADLEALGSHVEKCGLPYLQTVGPKRILEHWRLCRSLRSTDDTMVVSSALRSAGTMRIDIVSGNVAPRSILRRIVRHLAQLEIDIQRAYLDVFEEPGERKVSILGVVVADDDALRGCSWPRLSGELARLRWLDPAAIELSYSNVELDLAHAEVAVALAHLAHAQLASKDRYAYSLQRLLGQLQRFEHLSRELAAIVLQRFSPDAAQAPEALEVLVASFMRRVSEDVSEERERHAFGVMLNLAQGVLRTNAYVPGRYGLAFRLDPAVLTPEGKPAPYGIFFVHGLGFDGFHVRFRDVARGGVRVVLPIDSEAHLLESERLFEEVYELSYAQQLKNKDIPEGGAKAVVLAEPGTNAEACFKGLADGLLDLITSAEETRSRVVDRLGVDERLYLGPDENVTPRLIEWVVARAAQRGLEAPYSFMSSKPGAGINHKEYGVTSEGVTVFLHEALLAIGIDPAKETFTVKITGGPDGDVAGNEIKILFREYGDRVRVVGIADGSGVAEDPDGLDRDALLGLVAASAPIAQFPRQRLGERGTVAGVDTPEGRRLRNSMHLRVAADAFIPAGGRPGSIHGKNWQEFLVDGRPTSRVIVEGANLFLTPEARSALSREGVLIVKDSSANKCGVICSSYEVLASLLLGPEEFLATKARFVGEILVRLRRVAREEAVLLFAEHRRKPALPLPELSVEMSRCIERANDALIACLQAGGIDALLRAELVKKHLPPVLQELGPQRLQKLPRAYADGIVAASLATKLVYREGLNYLDGLAEDAVAELAERYVRAEFETERLAEQVLGSALLDRDRIAMLLRRGGPRALADS